jgi:hypothetical protein
MYLKLLVVIKINDSNSNIRFQDILKKNIDAIWNVCEVWDLIQE